MPSEISYASIKTAGANLRVFDKFSEPQFYTRGSELFGELLLLIHSAQEEILISTYSFEYDKIGAQFVRALSAAAKRGVRVRVVFDDFGSRNTGRIVKKNLEESGVGVRIFRPLEEWILRHPMKMMCRDHARIVLIDRKIFGLGGMSFADVYEGRKDLFMICSSLNSGFILLYFKNLWELAVNARPQPQYALSVVSEKAVISSCNLIVSGPESRSQEIAAWIADAVLRAKDRILIASPFFFPEKDMLKLLHAAKSRGVKIKILTPLRTDKPRYDRFRAMPAPLLEALNSACWKGVHQFFHSKIFIADNAWTIGSANFDIISTRRNYELNLAGQGGPALVKLENIFAGLEKQTSTRSSVPSPIWMRLLAAMFYDVAEFFFKLT
jgi:cardiolipin synthase A/B